MTPTRTPSPGGTHGLVLASPWLIGDTLLATPAIRAYRRAHPHDTITVCCPDDGGPYQVLRHNPHVDVLLAGVDPASVPGRCVVLDPESALRTAFDHGRPMAWGYGRHLDVEIDGLRYDYVVTAGEDAEGARLAAEIGRGRPVVLFGRHSVSCSSNLPHARAANKCIDNFYWAHLAADMMRHGYATVAIGSADEARDPRFAQWPGERLYGAPLRVVAALCARCAGVMTVDNGIRHLAAAAGAHLYALSGAVPLQAISCVPVRPGQRIVEEACLVRNVNVRTLPRGAQRLGL